MECYKFVCKGCDNPLEFACEPCPCYKECICCVYFDSNLDSLEISGYCNAYDCDIIFMGDD